MKYIEKEWERDSKLLILLDLILRCQADKNKSFLSNQKSMDLTAKLLIEWKVLTKDSSHWRRPLRINAVSHY
jgi:hypothetical protein